MALHGDLSVGGQVIGNWSAQRMGPLDGVDEEHDYQCVVDRHPSLLKPAARYTFVVSHRYSDGAYALASRVLAEAAGTGM